MDIVIRPTTSWHFQCIFQLLNYLSNLSSVFFNHGERTDNVKTGNIKRNYEKNILNFIFKLILFISSFLYCWLITIINLYLNYYYYYLALGLSGNAPRDQGVHHRLCDHHPGRADGDCIPLPVILQPPPHFKVKQLPQQVQAN